MSSVSGTTNGHGKEAALYEEQLSKVISCHLDSIFCLFATKWKSSRYKMHLKLVCLLSFFFSSQAPKQPIVTIILYRTHTVCILIFLFLSCQIGKVRTDLGQLSGKSALYCSDASIARYLIARNWDVKKATRMLKTTLKWRSEYKPDEIRWVRFFPSHIALKYVTMVHV